MSDTHESPVEVADLDDLRSAATALWERGLRTEHFAVQDAIREIDRLRDQLEAVRQWAKEFDYAVDPWVDLDTILTADAAPREGRDD